MRPLLGTATSLSFNLVIMAPLILGMFADPLNGASLGLFSPGAHVHIPEVFADLDIGLVVVCAPDLSTSICFPVPPPPHQPQHLIDTPCSNSDCMLNFLEDLLETSDRPVLIAWVKCLFPDVALIDSGHWQDECRVNDLFAERNIVNSDDNAHFYVTTIIHNGELLSQISEECNAISRPARLDNQRTSIPGLIQQRTLEKIIVHKIKANGWDLGP
ncbi:hypothetical protein BDN72DRAFT_88322 [Pluteus cervinus]|uniref:Uncharacterized protein n=1 Tax=Pluteus cervinus TaxID=181527 RepID=A0ACD3AQN7_9AGAR|nr:hypothetical protein BDN72DRAFT_88322 [Pluteus cervinus]